MDRRVEEGRPALARVRGVEKSFGAITAVRDVTCAFRPGELHAVCGENGAGKSTLLKLVAGMLEPDVGEVIVAGAPLAPHTPGEAIRRGVAMVLQHFALVPVFTVLENVMLGAEPVGLLGALDRAAARARAATISRDLGLDLRLDARVEELGVGDRQRVEIARALFRDARLVILDEPTAVLTKSEAASLYGALRRLAGAGKGVVVVTHKIDEVRAHADVVTVMRRGELVFTRPLDRAGDLDGQIDAVTAAIMGVELGRSAPTPAGERGERGPLGEPVLVMSDVDVGAGLRGVSLSVSAGEIVGVAGVEGNGQRELVAVLAGEARPTRGSIVASKTAVVREDRQVEGLVLDASLRDNLVLGELARFARWGVLDLAALDEEARARLARSGALRSVSTATRSLGAELERPARTLSGGNQQKIVVARALARDAGLIVVAQPTRGVDVGAARELHAALVRAARRHAGLLVISADLDELRALASRIVVLARGRIVAELPPTASDDEIGRAMLGLADASAEERRP